MLITRARGRPQTVSTLAELFRFAGAGRRSQSCHWSAACPLRNPQELMEAAGISPGHIAQAARDLLGP